MGKLWPVLFAAALLGCAREELKLARARSAHLEEEFEAKKKQAARYFEVRAEVERLHGELALAPEKPALPSLPPALPRRQVELAATSDFPAAPDPRTALLAQLELRELYEHHDDAVDEIKKIELVLDAIQDMGRLKRRLQAVRISVVSARAASHAASAPKR